MHLLLVFFSLILLINKFASGYPDGSNIPTSVCSDLTPQHGFPSQPATSNVYAIFSSFDTFLPQRTLHIYLEGFEVFQGFYVQGRRYANEEVVGSFNLSNPQLVATHSCPSSGGTEISNTISHTLRWRNNASSFLAVNWISPAYNGEIYFRGTFVQTRNTFWTGIESTVLYPLRELNFTECCHHESSLSDSTRSFCTRLENQNFAADSVLIHQFIDLVYDDQLQGVFTFLRCLHWSSASLTANRTRLRECCANISRPLCKRFCNAGFYTSFDGFVNSFEESFQSCIEEDDATMLCQFNEVVTERPTTPAFTTEFTSPEYEGSTTMEETTTVGATTSSQVVLSPTFSIDPVYPDNAVVYGIAVTILGSVPPHDRDGVISLIEDDLLFPSLSNLPGYYCVRATGDFILPVEVIFDFEVIFIAFFSGTSYQFPLMSTVTMEIDQQASSINYVINGPSLTTFYLIDTNILVTNTEINQQCTLTPNACSLLYQVPPTCVEVGRSSFACVCSLSNNEQVHCADFPLPPIQPTSLRYFIVSTILVGSFTQEELAYLVDALEQDLLLPALSTLPDYHSTRYVNSSLGSLIVTSLTEFRVSELDNLNNFPTVSMIESNLQSRASELGNTLSSALLSMPTSFSSNFRISHEEVNGVCNSGVACPMPPSGYTDRCVEVGSTEYVCLCVSIEDNREADCSSIEEGQSGEAFPVGAIVGIALGGLALVVIIIIVVYCMKKRKTSSAKRLTPPHSPSDGRYLSPKEINSTIRRKTLPEGENIYMEVSSDYYGAYLELDNDPAGLKNKTDEEKKMPNADGYQLANDVDEKPELPKNHPTLSLHTNEENIKCETEGSNYETLTQTSTMPLKEAEDGYLIPERELTELKNKQNVTAKSDENAKPEEIDTEEAKKKAIIQEHIETSNENTQEIDVST